MSSVYDFLSTENKHKWEKELHSGLRKILKQVHPRLQIDEEATDFLELLVYQLLSQVCSAQPHAISDIEEHVQATFAYPIDQWSLNEAHEKLEKHSHRKRSLSLFPVERIHHQLIKDVLGYKIDGVVIQFTMNVLDYVAADILKLAGNFVKTTRLPSMIIMKRDIEVSLSADTSLQALFKQFQQSDLVDVEINTDMSSMKYDELLRDLIDSETSFIRQLNILLKVFYPPFLSNVFDEEEVDTIFGPVQAVYDLSVTLLASIEEVMEVASEMSTQGSTYPQIGFCFEDITESGETSCYVDYTENYSDAQVLLEEMMNDPNVIQYLKEQTVLGNLPKLYIEAVKYVLPKALQEPIYHFYYYYTIMTAMSQATDDDEDRTAFESAISVAIGEKSLVEKLSQRFLPKKKEEAGLFGRRAGFKLSVKKLTDIQNKVEGWDGPDIHTHCTELIREGTLMVAREGGRKSSKQKAERYVFLLDGLVICCKTRKNGNTIVEYRMKEKLSIKRDMLLKDFSDNDEMKFSFELISSEHPSLIFFAKDRPEKNEWIAAFTVLLTRSAFERQLNLKLREEEKEIPTLVPDPQQYLFAERDSDDNILFEEEQRDNHLLIKAATIHKLIERLTYHEYADPTFVKTFLMTYRSFCKPGELLNYLIDRYHIPPPVSLDSSDSRRDLKREAMKRYKANYVSPIQLRVLNVLRHWVENHYYDFQQDTAALDHLKEFVGTVKAKNVQKWVSSIHRALAKREARADQSLVSGTNPVFFQSPPIIEWHITRNKEDFNILTLHPVEFARQLTLILSELFRAIQSSELVDASWTKDSKKEDAAPNLLKMSRFETKLTNWIRYTIVFTENFEERVALCSRLIDIMMELKEMNNFAALFAINAAFQCSQVFRLRSTHKELTKKKQALDEFQQLCASDKGYRNYKERLRAINPPCVPFLGMYLTWIVFIRDGNDGKVKGKPEHFINFKKRRMIADILQEIQQYQNSRYCLKAEPMIQDYLKSHDVQGDVTHNQWEDQLYDQSLEIEPRDQPPKKSPREHKYDLRPPSSNPGTFAHILDATIRRPAKKQGEKEEETTTTPTAVTNITSSTTSNSESVSSPVSGEQQPRKQDTGSPTNNEEPPPKPPPKLPPKPLLQFSSHILGGSYDLSSPGSPPPPIPRSLSPKLDPYLKYQADTQGHRKPPPLPPPPSYDEVIRDSEVPPVIPKRPDHLASPQSPIVIKDDNKLHEESVPPIPPRPHSPVVINNDDTVPPPLPPPPSHKSESPPTVPPPLVLRVPNTQVSNVPVAIVDNKIADELKGGNSDLPPIVPPKPAFSSPVPSIVPPPVAPRVTRITSEPINNDEVGVAPPPIPPKPVR